MFNRLCDLKFEPNYIYFKAFKDPVDIENISMTRRRL